MVDVVITQFEPRDRARWARLWRGYLDFHETSLPLEIHEHTWQRLIAAESPIRGFGARLGVTNAPGVGIGHFLFHAHAWTMKEVSAAALIWLVTCSAASGQAGPGAADRYTATIEGICRQYAAAQTGMPPGPVFGQCMAERHCRISADSVSYRCEPPGPMKWHGGGY